MTLSNNAQEIYDWFIGAPFHIFLILVFALVLQKIGGRAVTKAINRIAEADFVPGPKRGIGRQRERARTAGTLLRSSLNAVIWVITLSMVLSELGFNLGPIVASAGVIGVALGLGAQSIVRDVLAGMFMLVEDQYGVGDQIETMEVVGVVESVGLRITTVRSLDETLWYLRNGEILKVGNKSQPRKN
ncbi:MAG: mechanosensitive ion channel family protein [Actinomycetes bacterium]